MQEEKDSYKEPMWTQAEILRHGWTKKMIEVLLPKPMYSVNPMYRNAAKVKKWYVKDIAEAERRPEFDAMLSKANERRMTTAKSYYKKLEKMDGQMQKIESNIIIPRYPIDWIMEQSLIARINSEQMILDNKRQCVDEWMLENYLRETNEAIRKHWAVEFILKELVPFDCEMDEFKGKVGVNLANNRYKYSILNAIYEIYPELI